MSDTITGWIIERRARIAALDEQRKTLEIEIRSFEAALAVIPETSSVDRPRSPSVSRGSSLQGKRNRGVSAIWKSILDRAIRRGNSMSEATPIITLRDVEAASTQLGLTMSPDNVRSQMAAYVIRGYFTRDKAGEFCLTADGATALAIFEEPVIRDVVNEKPEANEKPISFPWSDAEPELETSSGLFGEPEH